MLTMPSFPPHQSPCLVPSAATDHQLQSSSSLAIPSYLAPSSIAVSQTLPDHRPGLPDNYVGCLETSSSLTVPPNMISQGHPPTPVISRRPLAAFPASLTPTPMDLIDLSLLTSLAQLVALSQTPIPAANPC